MLVLAVVLWWLLWLFAHTDRSLAMRSRQIALFLAAFACYCLTVALVVRLGASASRRLTWFVVAAGIVFRISVAPVRPVTTSDIYRYLWEGRVVRAGLNPFAEPPDSPKLAHLRDRTWAFVQFKSVPAAYPPVAQYVFAVSGLPPGDPITAMKLTLAAFDIGTLLLLPGLLARTGRPRAWVLVYAWHPLIIGEVVARGHFDSIGIFFMVLAARLLSVRSPAGRALCGASLAASILSKGYAVLALPFFLKAARTDRLFLLASLLLVAVVACLPFASAGAHLLHGFSLYAARWQGNASIFALVDSAFSLLTRGHALVARVVCGAALAAWMLVLLVRQRAEEGTAAALGRSFAALAGFFLLSPVVYPWYLAWTVPFLCLRPSAGWLALTGTIYGFYAHDFAGHHVEIWWVTALEYGIPLAVALAARLLAGPRRALPNPRTHSEGRAP
jgi:hypothetical protein